MAQIRYISEVFDQRVGKCEGKEGGEESVLGAGEQGGRGWLGAGEGLAKAREELTTRATHPSENCPLSAFIFKQK